ncbi:MAG: cytochrome ubiquinol oxidase subunit I [Armatimonadota bacterium]
MHLDAVLLSRIQFALTVGFHFLFPPLTIGLGWIIVWMMTRYKRTQSDFDRNLARFWIKLFGLSFVVGVASGITMEFQFGTNWAQYSRFVGDIFGAPLAVEAIFTFFLESTFLAVLLLGWDRVSTGVMWFASLMVAIGATLSAFWILVANSWQQTPAGYHLANGRAELTSFAQAVFNPSTLPRFLHTVDGALITGAMFMMGISAWFLLKRRNVDFAKSSMRTALLVAFVAAVIELPLGHYHAVQVAHTQPAKLAAIEGLFKTQRRAPAIAFCILNPDKCETKYTVQIPGLLSLLAFGNWNAEVTGLEAFSRDEWPPIAMTFYSFHSMVLLGMYFIGMTALGIFLLWRGKLFESKRFLRLALVSIPLPFIANELGWMTAEVGRQPWIVYKLLRTGDAISITVPAGQILATIILFCLVYALLFVAWILVLRREMRLGPAEGSAALQRGARGGAKS